MFGFLHQESGDKPLEVMVHQKLCMGSKSASYLSIQCLHKIAESCQKTDPQVANTIRKAYCDNILIFGSSAIECNTILKKCIDVLEKYYFQTHEITSDSDDVLRDIPQDKLSSKNVSFIGSQKLVDLSN